jgi:hypothetical protein
LKRTVILTLLAVFAFVSCKKDPPASNVRVDDNPVKIELRTLAPGYVANYAASLFFEILDDGGEDLTAVGICWSLNQEPKITDSVYSPGKKTGSYNVRIEKLLVDTRYYARAFATNRFGTVYGNRVSFITNPLNPAVENAPSSSITQTSVVLAGRVTADGGARVTERGFFWDTVLINTARANKLVVGADTGSFSATISGLKPGFNYYYAAFATNKAGTTYQQLALKTLDPSPPTIVTTPISVSGTEVISGGTITAAEGITITERGIITIPDFRPELTSRRNPNGSGAGNFQSVIGPATSGSSYRIQAYAEFRYKSGLSGPTVYGQTLTFKVP